MGERVAVKKGWLGTEGLEILLNPRAIALRPDVAPPDPRSGSRLRSFAGRYAAARPEAAIALDGIPEPEVDALRALACSHGIELEAVRARERGDAGSGGLRVHLAGPAGRLRAALAELAERDEPWPAVASLLERTLEGAAARRFTLPRPGGTLELGGRLLLMGIVNRTPDSFSDGGRYLGLDEALAHAGELVEAGADWIDVGGESTRPGAEPVDAEEETRRVVPLVRAIAGRHRVPVSVDTTKAVVAERALEAGATILNDVSGLRADPRLGEVAAATGVPIVLMHRLGDPRAMQDDPRYDDVAADLCRALRESLAIAREAGVDESSTILDPGIGFGKTLEHNLEILRALPELRSLARPLLVGTSRKRFLGWLTGAPAGRRQAGTAVTLAECVRAGVAVARVHDVREMHAARAVAEAIRGEADR